MTDEEKQAAIEAAQRVVDQVARMSTAPRTTIGALVSGERLGSWGEDRLEEASLLAPHLLPVEVANAMRRTVASGKVGRAVAGAAVADVLSLPLTLVPFARPLLHGSGNLRRP